MCCYDVTCINITNMADEWYINYSETVDGDGGGKSIDCKK